MTVFFTKFDLSSSSLFRFQSEEEKLSVLVEREKDEIEMLEMVLSSVEHIETLHENKELDLVRAKEEFTKLKEKYPQEYRYSNHLNPVFRCSVFR